MTDDGLLTEIKDLNGVVTSWHGDTQKRIAGLEDIVNEHAKRLNRPGFDSGYSAGVERKDDEIEMCRQRHSYLHQKNEGPPVEYEPSGSEVDEAAHAIKAWRGFMRHGDLHRLPEIERKSLSAFSFGNGWLLQPEQSGRVLSCLNDVQDAMGLFGQLAIGAGSGADTDRQCRDDGR